MRKTEQRPEDSACSIESLKVIGELLNTVCEKLSAFTDAYEKNGGNNPLPAQVIQNMDKVLHELLEPVARLEFMKKKPLLTPKEVEALYSISALSLSTWRSRGGGPQYIQPYPGGPVRYSHEAIKGFQEKNEMKV